MKIMYSKIGLFLFLLLMAFSFKANADSTEEQGRQLYLSYGCAVCHGKSGEGNGISAQKFDPPPTNFHEPDKYRYGNDKGHIRYSIIQGIKEENSGMPSFEHIPKEELDKMIIFLISLQKKEK